MDGLADPFKHYLFTNVNVNSPSEIEERLTEGTEQTQSKFFNSFSEKLDRANVLEPSDDGDWIIIFNHVVVI